MDFGGGAVVVGGGGWSSCESVRCNAVDACDVQADVDVDCSDSWDKSCSLMGNWEGCMHCE